MTHTLDFAVWAPDADTFWNSWIAAGICTAPYEFTAEYPGITISDQTSQGWTPTRATGQTDANGNAIREPVPGWHANVRIVGGLVWQFTNGLPQTDENGAVLDLFQRTWATMVFSLTQQPTDPVTGFPAGYRNADGVTYCDTRDIRTPTNVFA